MATKIRSSVGKNGRNRSNDVRAVKQRLQELGFGFFQINGNADAGLIMAIRLFQSIIKGSSRVKNVDGRVDANRSTNKFLDASNAPRWQTMPFGGLGYTNFEARDVNDHHDFGTSWMADTLIAAGASYHSKYLAQNPDAGLLTINDISLVSGGDTPDHKGHETGLACDIRLPKKGGGSGGISNANTNKRYDRNAMRAQLKALRKQPLLRRVFFNDKVLAQEGLCERRPGHNDHAHFELRAPRPKLQSTRSKETDATRTVTHAQHA